MLQTHTERDQIEYLHLMLDAQSQMLAVRAEVDRKARIERPLTALRAGIESP